MIESTPRFLQGAFRFNGDGYDALAPLDPALSMKIPFDKRAQPIYMRLGNSSAEMIYVALMIDGKPVRLFPVGAKDSTHVPLAVVEDLQPESRVELYLAAPAGCSGTVVVDFGLVEI